MKKFSLAKKFLAEAKRIAGSWSDANASIYGAAVAYYTAFSIAPLLVIALSIAGLVVKRSAAEASIITQFTSTFGANGAVFLRSLISSGQPQGANIALSVIGIVFVLLGATGIFDALESALDAIFSSLPKTKTQGILKTIRHKAISIGMILSVGFSTIISLLVSALLAAFSSWFQNFMPGDKAIAFALDLFVSLVLISLFLGLMHKFLPSSHKLDWKPAFIGGLIAGIFFTIGKYALGLYLGSSHAGTAYGAASSLVLIILWMYYMSQVFFLSAVLTKLYIVPKFK